MLDRIKTWLFKQHRVAGLTMSIKKEGTRFQLIILEQQGAEIQVVQQWSDLETIEQVVDVLPNNIPTQLCLNGRGILHKKLNSTSDQQLIQSVLPNADPAQFYLQKTPIADGVIASVIRQKTLDDTIEQLVDNGIWITGLSLGVFDLKTLWPYLSKPSTISSHGYQLQFNSTGVITTFHQEERATNFPFQIGDDQIPSLLLPSYSKALQAILGFLDHGLSERVQALKAEYQQKQVFDKTWKVSLGLIGMILLMNTFFYFYYKEKDTQLTGASAFALAQITQLDTLKAKLERHQQLMQLTRVNQRTDLSFYADELGKSLSKGLKLLELNIFPMIGKDSDYNQKNLVRYHREQIRIKGQCDHSSTYNSWIKQLETLDWVNNVQHLDYKDISHQLSAFELNITIATE